VREIINSNWNEGSEMHLVIQTALGIPQLPCDLLQVRASVEEIVSVWMKDGEDRGLLD
jgi:hypothetical protein